MPERTYRELLTMLGSLTTSNPGLQAAWAKTCYDMAEQKADWIAGLRQAGIKAAHPDDGWIDRKENSVHFAYPHFDDGVQVGDLIALGWPYKKTWRTVRVVGEKVSPLGIKRWLFEPIQS